MAIPLRASLIALAVMGFTLSACDSDDKKTADAGSPKDTPLSLRILHINDHHSHLQSNSGDLMLAGESTRVAMGGFAKVVEKINQRSNGQDNVLKLHAGDAITGDLYFTLFKGEADAAMMNQVCFDAFALGNHEFDEGDAGLVKFLDYLKASDCKTDVLAANVKPEVGVSPLAKTTATDYFKPYTVRTLGGEQVGIVGIDIAQKTKNSSNPDDSTQFLDETQSAQGAIDELLAKGVKKIILMTHYQYQNDIKLAAALTDVDVIVGGDSHTLLGAEFKDLGLNPSGDYPTMLTNKNGEKVCVAQAWEYSNVVGELNVTFNAQDGIESCTGVPHLLLADSFKRKNADGDRVELEGAERQAVLDAVSASPVLSVVADDQSTAAKLQGFTQQVDALKETVVGTSVDRLCHERIPGQGRSTLCDVTDTQSKGSDIANIVALAFKTMSKTSDIAIQNGGGVREDVDAGDITLGTAYKLLPFANTLVELDMTGQQIVNVLEEAFDYAIDPDGSTGAYPYASGLRWALDRSQDKGARFSSVQVKLKDETEWSDIDLQATYKVVTNSFIAGGRDGYVTFGEIAKQPERIVDTYLDYAQSFVKYVEAQPGKQIQKLADEDYSTQSYRDANGVLQ